MSKWILSSVIAFLGLAMVIPDAEARRFGGGRSLGTQRSVTPPPKAPQQAQQAAPGQQNPQAAAPAAGSRWGGILGGLAIGGLLAYLFAGNPLFGALVSALLLGGLVFLAVVVVRSLLARRQDAPQPVQFAGLGGQRVMATPPSAPGAAPGLPAATRAGLPAGFDEKAFLRGAKMNFVKLQLANDRADLSEIREFTTDEVFEEVKQEVLGRAGGQETEIGSLEAELLEVSQEGDRFWASVKFSGLEREAPGAAAAPFGEVWHLVKPADGSTGWLLAGIQPMHGAAPRPRKRPPMRWPFAFSSTTSCGAKSGRAASSPPSRARR